jgi:hypothetical protein
VGQLIGLAQDPVEARLRGDVQALVSQGRHDLTRWQVSEFRRIGDVEDLPALVLGELVGRLTPGAGLLAPIGLHLAVFSPTLQRAR